MSDLDRLASRAAIQDLYSDKLIAVDKRQEGRLASIWWDDAEWTIEGIGTYKGPEGALDLANNVLRSEEHTSELQSLMRISYAVFCLKKTKTNKQYTTHVTIPYELHTPRQSVHTNYMIS